MLQLIPFPQTPKLLWLKRHHPLAWSSAAHFFDLPDYLTWRCTGRPERRSLCSAVCKWTYEVDAATGKDKGWSGDFFRRAGMGELAEDGFKRLGTDVRRYAKRVIGKCTVFLKKYLVPGRCVLPSSPRWPKSSVCGRRLRGPSPSAPPSLTPTLGCWGCSPAAI